MKETRISVRAIVIAVSEITFTLSLTRH